MVIDCIDSEQIEFSYEELDYFELLEYARSTLPFYGELRYNENESYCYLKVHDDFILKLFPSLYKEADVLIPFYFPPDNICGAHISLVYPEEVSAALMKNDIVNGYISGVYTFDIDKVVKVTVRDKVFYTVTVVSAELEALRVRYNLPPKLDYKKFMVPLHITIAIKQGMILCAEPIYPPMCGD